jgi:putative FmdB family regulatory protein
MPTYEYICKACGEHVEVVQSFTDKPMKKHAADGGELKKVFHARGVVFKGSGFYATDSRASTSRNKSTKETKPASKNGSKDGSNGASGDKKAATSSPTPAKTAGSDSSD